MSALPRVTSTAAEAQEASKHTSDLSHLHAPRALQACRDRSSRLSSIAVSAAPLAAETDPLVPLNTRKELAAERALFTTFRWWWWQ